MLVSVIFSVRSNFFFRPSQTFWAGAAGLAWLGWAGRAGLVGLAGVAVLAVAGWQPIFSSSRSDNLPI